MTTATDMLNLTPLLTALAALFDGERRPGGDEAAAALRSVGHQTRHRRVADVSPKLVSEALDTVQTEAGPLAAILSDVLPHLAWHYSGLSEGRIRADIARSMITCELIGRDGMIYHDTVRCGLFFQTAGLDYVTRHHPAEETFVMVAGEGWWSVNGAKPTPRTAGDVIFHPSNAPHVSITRSRPLLAAWRWTGDIRYEGYKLTG